MLLLVPSDPLRPRRVDDHFQGEADAASELGVAVRTVDHDALSLRHDGEEAVRFVDVEADDAVYRGWMIRSEEYFDLAECLRRRNVRLRTTPSAYRSAHELPGWYQLFQEETAPSVWLHHPGTAGLVEAAQGLPPGGAIVKDWVKSMKHYWAEATLVPDVHNADGLLSIAERLLELRSEDLVGGVVVRAFEEYEPHEVRTWWVNGECAIVSAHPDSPDQAPHAMSDVSDLRASVLALGSPFVTVDLARRSDGRLRVVEIGDGQVSDRPSSLAALT